MAEINFGRYAAKATSKVEGGFFDVSVDPGKQFVPHQAISSNEKMEVEQATTWLVDDAAQLLQAINNPVTVGSYDNRGLISWATEIAQSELTPAGDPRRERELNLLTAYGGSPKPGIFFPSYFVASAIAAAGIESWNSQIDERAERQVHLNVNNRLLIAMNAAIAVNHAENPDRRRAVEITTDVNQHIMREYLQHDFLGNKARVDMFTDTPWEETPWVQEIIAASTPILREICDGQYDPNDELAAKAHFGLMKLVERGGNHGDGEDLESTLRYISIHTAFFNDVHIPGSITTQNDIIMWNKRDERLFKLTRDYLAREILSRGLLGAEEIGYRIEQRNKLNSDRAAYYPAPAVPRWGTWHEHRDWLIEILTNPKGLPLYEDKQGNPVMENSGIAKSRYTDATWMLGTNMASHASDEHRRLDHQRRAAAYVDMLIETERQLPQLVAEYSELNLN